MHNVFKGIVVGVLGFFVWFVASIYEGVVGFFAGRTAMGTFFMVVGFVLMIGGPVAYIVVIPVINRLRRR